MSELTRLTATEMAAQVRNRKISPVELVKAHLERILQLNPKFNAFVSLNEERALTAARAAESALLHGDEVGPLHGVPVSIKSSIDVAGLLCEAGTRLRAGHVPEKDAALVSRLKSAGAIILGTTNTAELLMAWETSNVLHGRTSSPWDLERTPGGSSGGEAAAIAACMSAGGVGSDGGGSIRVPAHFSGICGLKPTPGRVPASGHYPESLGPFAMLGVVGPMARTIADVKLLFEAMAGPDPGDTSAARVPLRKVSKVEARKLRIGYFEEDPGTPVTPETRAAVGLAADALRKQGFEVQPFAPDFLEPAHRCWWTLFGVAGGMLLGSMLAGHEDDLSPVLKDYAAVVASLLPISAETFLNAWLERDALRLKLLARMQEFPILLSPVCSIPAFRHYQREWSVDGTTVRYPGGQPDVMIYSECYNLLGNPAASVPVSQSREGLPIGVQIVGRPYEEEEVLAVAAFLDREFGYEEPPLSRVE
jgi:Asp-tRNA(Asn)/Glu-tRNA(Gln) amidotransferase A subunit family amidase